MAYFFLGSALYFFAAAIFNFWSAGKKIGPFVNRGQVGGINGMSIGVKEFIAEFNPNRRSQLNRGKEKATGQVA